MTFKHYRISVYVGPTHVAHYAENARKAGYLDVFEGVQHVHAVVPHQELVTETDRLVFRNTVANTVYGAVMTTGWRDVAIVRAV